jgi:hypothetical protein
MKLLALLTLLVLPGCAMGQHDTQWTAERAQDDVQRCLLARLEKTYPNMSFKPRLLGERPSTWLIKAYGKDPGTYNSITHAIDSRGFVNVFDITIFHSATDRPVVRLNDRTDWVLRMVMPVGEVKNNHVPACLKPSGTDAA